MLRAVWEAGGRVHGNPFFLAYIESMSGSFPDMLPVQDLFVMILRRCSAFNLANGQTALEGSAK